MFHSLAGIIFISVLSTAGLMMQQTDQSNEDLFAKYRVVPTFSGKAAEPMLESRETRLYRTQIRQGAAKGAVFADHYAVAVWGCGAGCLSFAIIDAIAGKVYIFPASVSQVREIGERLTYHRDSRAMHIIGSLNEKHSADRWYIWDGEKLNLISEKPARLGDDQSSDKP